jgi:hypothetical protein
MNPPGAAPMGGGGMAMADGNRVSQYVANQLRPNWNPVGWQRELLLQERVQTIMEMYVGLLILVS